MKLKFDSSLEYQLEAIKSVTDLFEGLPQAQGGLGMNAGRDVANLDNLSKFAIHKGTPHKTSILCH